ncbi:UNVERIFIED_CONTAM: ribosome biogenesis GTPase YqeH [Streptococcus canis]|uniref:GTP-binding protein YqeH n=1 Tax=Streptococcus canis FSL Z3-227 TaxID=482234 RepID=A0AAV3FQ12_STRCB|nr:ribosome biogenesis GTPase YqeH [Streptococcus canis]EIQ81177.1 GTP-binding protein YqeH [Streptococcus canis FSL Z3-227]MDV5987657.1 ribosome biogenesis GTPase YqeH [Streptococcus canis]MDV5993668.1 ribosome biogenesis GTPase YqeH [Streptococcus canis]MDV6001278.1 ribosome biogenesis GTPase YqeH [Streptococcus canis]MDV6022905.1 ribosome biogenesis GTPase YqeH [Streptococcus canis]
MEELFCIGCGIQVQTEDKKKAGFTPAAALKKGLETGELYCQRCFRLRHYNDITDVHITDDEFLRLLHEVGDSDALVVNVVDIFDFNGSIIPGLSRFVSGNDVLLVGNKKDILPKSVKDGKVTQWLVERAHEEGLRPLDVMLTSAQNKYAIKELIERINTLRKGRNVYVVGVTNVGKSTLINAIIQEVTGDKDVITTSRFPGTTLDKIEIPLDDGTFIFDTPGIIHRHQMAHYLSAKDLKVVSPKKEIKPKTYQLNPKQTLFLGGLARFDFISGERQGFTAFFDNELGLHRTKLTGADTFYDKHLGGLLTPPGQKEAVDFPKLVRHEFVIDQKMDLVFSGLGWIRINGQKELKTKIAAWAPEGVAVLVRKAII